MRKVIHAVDCRPPAPTLGAMQGRRTPACWVAPHRSKDWMDLRWDVWSGPPIWAVDWAARLADPA